MTARLLRERPALGGNVVLARVHGNQREAGARVGNVAEAAVGSAVSVVDDCVRVATLGPEGLVGQRVGAHGVRGAAAGEVLAMVVVEVMVAVDHVKLRARAGSGELGLCRFEAVAYPRVTGALTILGEVTGNEDHVRLGCHDIGERLVEDVRALAEHLAVGVLRRGVVGAVAPELGRKEVDVAHHGEREPLGIGHPVLNGTGGIGGRCRDGGSPSHGYGQLQKAAARNAPIQASGSPGHMDSSLGVCGRSDRRVSPERDTTPRKTGNRKGLASICGAVS